MNLDTVYNSMRKQAYRLGGGLSPSPMSPAKPIGKTPVMAPPAKPAAAPAPQQNADQNAQVHPLTAMWQAFSQMANNYKQALNATTTAMKANMPQQQPGAAGVANGMQSQQGPIISKQAALESADTNWLMRKDTLDPGAYKHLRAQDYGKTTSFLLSLILGGGLGYLADKAVNKGKNPLQNTVGGAVTAGGVATLLNLLGTGTAAVTPTRTRKQHEAYQNSGTAAEWLVPGVANYNHAKTYGYALHGAEAEEKRKKKSEEA